MSLSFAINVLYRFLVNLFPFHSGIYVWIYLIAAFCWISGFRLSIVVFVICLSVLV